MVEPRPRPNSAASPHRHSRPESPTSSPTSQRHPATWRFTFAKPAAGWDQPDFDDQHLAARARRLRDQRHSGCRDRHELEHAATSGSVAKSPYPLESTLARLQLLIYHDEDAEIYLDGVLAASETGYVTSYQPVEIPAMVQAKLKPGAKVRDRRSLPSDRRRTRDRRRCDRRSRNRSLIATLEINIHTNMETHVTRSPEQTPAAVVEARSCAGRG